MIMSSAWMQQKAHNPKKRGHGEKDSNFAQTISSGSIVLQQIKRRRRK